MTSKKNLTKPSKSSDRDSTDLTSTNLDNLIGKINEVAIKTVERGAMEIGKEVLDGIYEGSLSEALSHSPNKGVTLQDICEHPNLLLTINRRTLGTWVKAAHLKKVLIDYKIDCSKLRYSHFAALLRVTKEDKLVQIAKSAIDGNWSARKIIDEIEGLKRTRIPKNGGRGNRISEESDDKNVVIRMVENPLTLVEEEAAQRISAEVKSILQEKSANRWDILRAIDDALEKMGRSTKFLRKLQSSLIPKNDMSDLSELN
jgi:hypothetical protein